MNTSLEKMRLILHYSVLKGQNIWWTLKVNNSLKHFTLASDDKVGDEVVSIWRKHCQYFDLDIFSEEENGAEGAKH